MKINNKIIFRFPNLADEPKNSGNRQQHRAITQSDTIYFQDVIAVTRKSNDVCCRFSSGDSDSRVWKTLPDRAQGRQAHDDVAELTEIYNQNVVRIKRQCERSFIMSRCAACNEEGR